MTQLGLRPRALLPCDYKGFHLILTHGRLYAIPHFLEPDDIRDFGAVVGHPATLSATTRAEIEARIDAFDPAPYQPQVVDKCAGYDLVRQGAQVYAIPESAGPLNLNFEEEWRRADALRGGDAAELQERIRGLKETVGVEFAGWLPIIESTANTGKHPQFAHTGQPPPGYHFTCSAPPRRPRLSLWDKTFGRVFAGIGAAAVKLWSAALMCLSMLGRGPRVGLRARARVLWAMFRLYRRLRRAGCRLRPTLSFLKSRHLTSQLVIGKYRGPVFLPSLPYTYGQNPWVVEIEDPTTLLYPHIQNGATCGLRLEESPYIPIVRTFLESDHCRGIITHMRSTARMVPKLFRSETIAQKIFYTPLGVKLPERWQKHDADDGEIHLVFINSWNQAAGNFYLRGGLDILEAFTILRERYPQLRLTLRTTLPALDVHYHQLIERGWVRVIDRVLPPHEMDDLLSQSHIFLLPSARVHIVSLLQAMSYGLAVVTSDGWGIEEYITHERNGLVVRGRYGKTAWIDEDAGFLREDYNPMCTTDAEVVPRLVEAISRLVEDRELRRRLGGNARSDVQNTYNLENWNEGLKRALDQAFGSDPPRAGVP